MVKKGFVLPVCFSFSSKESAGKLKQPAYCTNSSLGGPLFSDHSVCKTGKLISRGLHEACTTFVNTLRNCLKA